ncbi:glycerol dehydrogenase [Synechococcus sp. PROS-9-1]|uniref:iron-containing alcohol dehydrogenase family protein n=1 Tax=Synechococcus sp. PROS-9-1 TaxID=1968775 RepID=UPI00164684C5|nr:iron-containing alcohol dehydrogenase family protein [Synechococcus sp. PROS-9-1]QNJ31408.1 glycerol dehydrogenase [Synechococcus sp. PROS-9-1]|tara:strand:- start:3047 stop:4180 length:1134 start_codon:yes stop_codon:yes gene_type:complete
MTTSLVCHTHAIAPSRVIRGGHAWQQSLPVIADLCKRPLLLGRSPATQAIRAGLKADLTARDLTVVEAQLNFDCCEEDLIRLEAVLKEAACDCVIAAGGGKVLDAGKLLACRLKLPCITVPLSAATCAGWTALANIYSQDGAFVSDEALDACPDLLIFDHGLIRQAPTQTLASGIADALAKWYEASVGSGSSTDGIIQQAVQMARVLRDQLLIDAVDAISHPDSEAWVRVAEACGLTAGVIGGLGGAQCRTVAAHAVHNGLTQLPACHGRLHGEKVGFGILVQLRLEERLGGNQLAAQSRRQLLPLLKQLGVPVTLQDLGLGETGLHDLRAICSFACRPGSDLHHLPFEVTETDLLEALVSTDADSRSMSPSLETEA